MTEQDTMAGPENTPEEAPGLTPVQLQSQRVVGLLYGLFRNLEIHDENNQLFERITDEVLEALATFEEEVGEPFTLQMYGQELVVCSRLLRLDDAAFERASRLGELLVRAGVGGLLMAGDIPRGDLELFCRDLTVSLRGESVLSRGAYGAILFASLEEDPVTALATRPEQLALWLFSTLLDLTCDLEAARGQGKRPSLLPLKRVLQRISEAARRHAAVFQLVPAIRDFSTKLTVPRRAVCESLTALCFGIRIGLTRAELMSVAVAAILCRIGGEGEEALSEVLSYRGLSDLGPEVLLAAHDVLRPTPDSGLAGQLLSLVRSYEDCLAPAGDALPPAGAVARVLESPPSGVEPELVEMFAAWQGREPLGSPLELEDGELALVFGPSEHAAGRSRVAKLDKAGVLGEELDLGAAGAPTVRQHPSPALLQLDLTRVRTEG